MPCTEAYREHIMYTFNGYCKTVIRFAAINAWRDRSGWRQKEISLEYLTEEKFYPLGTTDEYFEAPYEEYPITQSAVRQLEDVYADNNAIVKRIERPFFSYENFYNNVIAGSKKIDCDIEVAMAEFEEKKNILQNLSDYKNTERNMFLSFFMLIISQLHYFLLFFQSVRR